MGQNVIEGVSVEVIGGLILAAIIAALVVFRGALRRRWALATAREKESQDQADAEGLRVLHEQVLQVAQANGTTVAERSTGSNPVVVTFSDGQKSWFYRDLPSYKRGLTSGQADLLRASWGKPPPSPVWQWDEAALREWLKKHA